MATTPIQPPPKDPVPIPVAAPVPPTKPVPGIIAPTVTTTSATANKWTVDPNQTVEARIGGIVKADSPLMQQAATAAKQQANQRGLLNSSMAVGAGQGAVLNAAMPIAQQDASTFANAARYNADALNSMAQFNAGAKNAASTQNAQLGLSAQQSNQSASLAQAQQGYDAAFKSAYQAADATNQQSLATLNGNIQKQLSAIEATYKTQMQTSASMADTYQGLVGNITQIMADPNMSADAKQAAINNVTKLYNSALKSQEAITGLNLGELLAFDEPAPGKEPRSSNTPLPYVPPPQSASDGA